MNECGRFTSFYCFYDQEITSLHYVDSWKEYFLFAESLLRDKNATMILFLRFNFSRQFDRLNVRVKFIAKLWYLGGEFLDTGAFDDTGKQMI